MAKLNIMIVEDELIIAEHLSLILEDLGYEVAGIAADYQEAVAIVKSQRPDFALLDVVIDGRKSGIDIAHFIRKQSPQIPFVYLSSHADKKTVEAAKKTQPNGYLVKPFEADDVYTAIEMALLNFGGAAGKAESNGELLDEEGFFIKEDHVFIKIHFSDIDWIESAKNYLLIHTPQTTHRIRATFGEIESRLPRDLFFRVHKSYLVHSQKITSTNGNFVVIKNKLIPVGRSKRKALQALIRKGKFEG